MNIQESWEKALSTTEIVRPRVKPLETFATTKLPYIFLAESRKNSTETMVRRGEIWVEKPSLVLPFNLPHFEGFDFEEEMDLNEDLLTSFLLVRGVTFPSMKYNNKMVTTETFEGRLSRAIEHYRNMLQAEENVHAGLVMGLEDVWQFSVLIFIGSQVAKSASSDFRKLFDDFDRRARMS
ncbi:MAG: hypothetical protein A3C47_03210 [Omnitrophica bacterium RIFCSPHIGHO2_02_FULL_51_18]|nr:MAG: hypothetical protein A3C47_03210 [Omnitrophica bacterium RIFCSPHIGHO2_02_FULL_51_18]